MNWNKMKKKKERKKKEAYNLMVNLDMYISKYKWIKQKNKHKFNYHNICLQLKWTITERNINIVHSMTDAHLTVITLKGFLAISSSLPFSHSLLLFASRMNHFSFTDIIISIEHLDTIFLLLLFSSSYYIRCHIWKAIFRENS